MRRAIAAYGSRANASVGRNSWSSAGPSPRDRGRLLGALLLGYYTPDGRLLYAGRVGTGMSEKTLRMLHGRLAPLATPKMALAAPPPRETRFGGSLSLSKVHWTKPQLVVEITYLTWADEGLSRHTVFVGLREDTPGREVRRETPAKTS